MAVLSLDEPEAAELLASVPAHARRECWWLVLRDGTPVPGDGGGGVLLLGELRLTRPLGRALERLRASALVDGFDTLVARRRRSLGRFVPDGPAPRRYP